MVTRVLFADDQIPWERDTDNDKVRQEIVKELGNKLPNVNEAYEQDKRWFTDLIDSRKTQGLELNLARTFSEAEQKIKQSTEYEVAIIDLSWSGDRRLKSADKKNAGLKLIDQLAAQNESGNRYTPVIAFSQNYKEQPLLVATVLEKAALPVQKEYSELGHRTLAAAVKLLAKLRPAVEPKPRNEVVSAASASGSRIFIGHGRSLLWRELKEFLEQRLKLPCDEFNRVPVAGYTTLERLEAMMSQAGFAFLIMTAEDEMADSSVQARPNVIHEVGLFQGKLGPRRAIVLVEEGCSEFSNITGLSQIKFPKGDIAARFEEMRLVLEREGLL
jgi:CheY-like chemotaxis protein